MEPEMTDFRFCAAITYMLGIFVTCHITLTEMITNQFCDDTLRLLSFYEQKQNRKY